AVVPTTCVLTDTKSLNKPDNAQVSIYPNPFTQSVTFDLSNVGTTDAQINIYNVVGTLVLKTSLTKQVNTVDASQLPAGVYVYTIYSANNTIQSGRLIAQ
ncbi:MAG TPA: T9SS type A sorting domain-containing protein, partial [Bacteroidia bacterium]|nr:T9SS type A sorting domain-containing protein [Bacteroidia bacterium]